MLESATFLTLIHFTESFYKTLHTVGRAFAVLVPGWLVVLTFW